MAEIPKKKPKKYKPMLDMLNTEAAVNTLAPKFYTEMVGMFSRKAYENGELDVDEYLEIVKPLFGEKGETITRKIEEYEDELNKYAAGGRVNYESGSMDPEISRLRERIIEIMDIEKVDFGEAYEQAQKELSRENISSGSGDYASKYLKYKDKSTKDRFNRIVNDLRTDLSLDSAISEALRQIREGSNND